MRSFIVLAALIVTPAAADAMARPTPVEVDRTPSRQAWVVPNRPIAAPLKVPLAGPMGNPNEVPGCLPFCVVAKPKTGVN